MTGRVAVLLAAAALLRSQPTVAPTNAPVGSPRGENVDGYNITTSFETGYRFRDVNGDLGRYRSDVNFGNGLRLLGSTLTVHSREGQGRYFDEIVLNTQGLGNDPYQFSNLRIQKNRFYRYDFIWRENSYFNPALTIAGGNHLLDTDRRLQDHNFTLLPQSPFKLLLGYSRNTQSGSGLSTIQLFDSRGDEFPLFSDVRRQQNEYRLGFELRAFSTRFLVMRGWENFKDDSREPDVARVGGANELDATTLANFRRDQPYHGQTKTWRVHAISDRTRLISWNGRFAYAGGRRNFIFDESATGTDRLGTGRTRQVFLTGNARRPVSTANFTISLFPSESVSISNHTAFHHTRMEGDGAFREINNATLGFTALYFQFLGIRTLSNQTDVQYSPTGWLGLHGGYHFSARRSRSIEQESFENLADRRSFEQDNRLHSGVFGVRIRPAKPLLILLDAEAGRANRPFYPISERNYQVFSGRMRYRGRAVSLTALARTNYNTNSAALAYHSFRSRTYGLDGSWSPRNWIGIDAGYNKLHLNTLSGLAYFVTGDLVSGRSVYISNIHSTNIGLRLSISRADLFVGYTRVEDTGGSRQPLFPNSSPISTQAFLEAQSYPMTFDSPQARLSVRLHTKLRWNAGYQFYRFQEDFIQFFQFSPIPGRIDRGYRAHTGYTSLTWSF